MVNLRDAHQANAENLSDFVEAVGTRLLILPPRVGQAPVAGKSMLGFAGLISVIVGGVTAYVADRYPPRIELLQTIGGLLLITGFGLASWGCPAIV